MKIAALIQAHHRPDCLGRLLDSLSGDLWTCYVHIDRKSDMSIFAPLSDKANFLTRRVPVYWGGPSLIRASLTLMQAAIANPEATHLYLMSGQDYPLRSDADIAQEIAAAAHGGNYIAIQPMPQPRKPMSRLSRRHFFDLPRPLARAVNKVMPQLLPQRDVAKLLHGIAPQAGSNWWLLDRAVAGAILDFLAANPWYERAFSQALCPDEMFFQTLFVHLGFTADNSEPTKAKWIQGNPNPLPVTAESYDEMRQGWHFMARKFQDFYPESSALLADLPRSA